MEVTEGVPGAAFPAAELAASDSAAVSAFTADSAYSALVWAVPVLHSWHPCPRGRRRRPARPSKSGLRMLEREKLS